MNLKMKAAQISKPGGDWEFVERDIPEPGAGQVRVKVDASGICHSDMYVKGVCGREFNILVCQVMKSEKASMRSART